MLAILPLIMWLYYGNGTDSDTDFMYDDAYSRRTPRNTARRRRRENHPVHQSGLVLLSNAKPQAVSVRAIIDIFPREGDPFRQDARVRSVVQRVLWLSSWPQPTWYQKSFREPRCDEAAPRVVARANRLVGSANRAGLFRLR